MENHYEGVANQIVSNIKEGHATMANIRTRAKERAKGLAESIANTHGILADAREMLANFAKDDRERAAAFKKKARGARTERVAANMARIAETSQMLGGYHKDSTERAKSFKQLLAGARAARHGRGAHRNGAAEASATKTAPRNGKRKKAGR